MALSELIESIYYNLIKRPFSDIEFPLKQSHAAHYTFFLINDKLLNFLLDGEEAFISSCGWTLLLFYSFTIH